MINEEMNALLERYLRPNTFPVAVRISKEKEVPEKYRRPTKLYGHRINLCQGVNIARRYGWSFGFLAEDMACPLSLPIFGFVEEPDFVTRGEIIFPDFTKTMEAAAKTQSMQPKAAVGSIGSILVAPLAKADFDPDLILVYGNPAQIIRMVQASLYNEGGAVESRFSGRCACAQEFIHPHVNQKCNVIIPAQGERLFAMTADDELVFSIPKTKIEATLEGLEVTHQRGVARIPTPFFALSAPPVFPKRYEELEKYCGTK